MVVRNPTLLADWPDRSAFEAYKRAIREAIATEPLVTRNRMLAEATAAYDQALDALDRGAD